MNDLIKERAVQLSFLEGAARIDALNELADLSLLRDYQQALAYADEAHKLAVELNDAGRIAESLRRMGRARQRLSQYENAEENYRQAFSLFKQLDNTGGQAHCLLGLGNTFLKLSQYRKAIEQYLIALSMFQSLNLTCDEGTCLMNIGISYSFLGEYSIAIDYYLKSQSIAQANNDIVEITICYNNIGDALQRLERWDESLEYYQQVLQTGQKFSLPHLENSAVISIGEIYIILERFEEARPLLEKGLLLSQEFSDRYEEIRALNALCQAYSKLKDSEQTRIYYEQGIALSRSVNNTQGEVLLHLSFGEHLFENGKTAEALEVLSKALEVSERVSLQAEVCRAHELLFAIYERQNNYQQAFAHHVQYHKLKQELHGEKQVKQIEALLIRQEVEKNREIAEIQQKLNEQLTAANQKLESINAEPTLASQRNQELLEQVQHQANHDRLTGLPNRILFDDRLEQTIIHATRYNKTFAVMFLDLDGFKNVNDTFGHDTGDQLLIQVAKRFQEVLRESDTLARVGGDEFTIIVSNLSNNDSASIVGQKLVESLSEPFIINEYEVSVGVSIGISLFPEDGSDKQTIQKRADIAMYEVKRHGKHGFRFFAD